MWDCLDSYTENTLPPDLVNLHEERHRIQADAESRARALQHLTTLVAWLLAETISLRRDHLLEPSNLCEPSRDVLRMQPFGGPFLFGGRSDDLLHRDSDRRTASMVLQISDHLFTMNHEGQRKQPNMSASTSPISSTSTSNSSYSSHGNHSFRGGGRGNLQGRGCSSYASSQRGGKGKEEPHYPV